MNETAKIEPPAMALPIAAIAFIAALAIIAGAITFIAWLNDLASGPDATGGIAAFLTGWLFVGFAYALRKLQLIEWRMQKPEERAAPVPETWAERATSDRAAPQPGGFFD